MEIIRKVVAGLVAITACLIYVHASHAVAPQQKGQAPGYYRMMLGDFEIVALSDGTVALDVRKLLTNTTPTRVDQLAAALVPRRSGGDIGQRLSDQYRNETRADRHGRRATSSGPRSATSSTT